MNNNLIYQIGSLLEDLDTIILSMERIERNL